MFATEAAPGTDNQDHVLASGRFVVVLDGVTEPPGTRSGCRHGVRWLVWTLGGLLAEGLAGDEPTPLAQIAADAIAALRARHGTACDLTNPDSPSTTVAILRAAADVLDYFVLCDSSIVIEYHAGGYQVVTDDRTSRLPAYDRATVARLRNTPGGFWVASTDPEAARQARTGSVPLSEVRRVAVLSDGAARLVEQFGRTWPQLFEILTRDGPRGVIEEVRRIEWARQPPVTGRRGKRFDDATVARCEFPPPTRP